MRLPKAPPRKWYDNAKVIFFITVGVFIVLRLVGLFDDLIMITLLAMTAGTQMANHVDYLQDRVDQLMELERQRQEGARAPGGNG